MEAAREDLGGTRPAQRQNLAAWMEHLDRAGGLYQPALDMVCKGATGGKSLPKRKPVGSGAASTARRPFTTAAG